MNRREKERIEGWLAHIRGRKPLAVIMGGSINGLSFARSLGRRQIPTLLVDSERLIGTYTRYGKVVILPPANEHPEDWVEFLNFVGSKPEHPGVLFATSDVHCVLVSEQSEALRPYFRFVVPKSDTLEQIVNKRIQYRIAEEVRIPIPRTYFPESVNHLRSLAKDVPYPCILKPYKSHLGRKKIPKKVVVIHSREELIGEYSRIATGDLDFMIQDIIPGPDSSLFGYLAFWDSEGHECNWLTKRKLRQNPPLYGDGSLQITVHEPEVAELSRRLLRTLNYRGFVGIEFKFDDRDQTFRLMEINPRTVSGNQMAISAGVDFPWIGYRYLTGSNTNTTTAEPFQPGIKYFNEEWDFKAYLALRKSGELTLGRWLRSVCGSKAKAIGAWDDPLPLIVLFWRFLQAFFRDMKLSRGKTAKE
jgi:predicted ATP-grasp superfamily ATP-dependent carboligase